MPKISEVKGKIVFVDGREHEFTIQAGYGWQQWGARPEQLAETGTMLDAVAEAIYENVEFTEADD